MSLWSNRTLQSMTVKYNQGWLKDPLHSKSSIYSYIFCLPTVKSWTILMYIPPKWFWTMDWALFTTLVQSYLERGLFFILFFILCQYATSLTSCLHTWFVWHLYMKHSVTSAAHISHSGIMIQITFETYQQMEHTIIIFYQILGLDAWIT